MDIVSGTNVCFTYTAYQENTFSCLSWLETQGVNTCEPVDDTYVYSYTTWEGNAVYTNESGETQSYSRRFPCNDTFYKLQCAALCTCRDTKGTFVKALSQWVKSLKINSIHLIYNFLSFRNQFINL